jgi:undecaprenyl-diphosphatase
MDFVAAIVLGIALGITEFLPISSLGHSLVIESLLKFPQSLTSLPTPDMVAIANAQNALRLFIQGGAVLAVIVFYARELLAEARKLPTDAITRRMWLNILIAFIPVGVLGLLFNEPIKKYLFTPWVVALALIVGGIILLVVEQREYKPTATALEAVTPRQALLIGLAQITALIPGVSRSGSTIVGGLLAGLSREVATSFTFFLFIPTLGAAAGYELFNQVRKHTLETSLLPYFALAFVIAFAVSLIAIRVLLRYVGTHNFKAFGIYRIVVGVLILVLIAVNVIH